MERHPSSTNQPTRSLPREMRMLDYMSTLMDNRFRIPGTRIRFGMDAVIGLIPGVGDIITYAMGSALILAMVRHGATVGMVLRMMWNLGIDTFLGAFPFLGDGFDVWFKANRRNYRIYREFMQKNKKGQPVWLILIIVLGGIAGLFFILFYLLFFWLPGLIWTPN